MIINRNPPISDLAISLKFIRSPRRKCPNDWGTFLFSEISFIETFYNNVRKLTKGSSLHLLKNKGDYK